MTLGLGPQWDGRPSVYWVQVMCIMVDLDASLTNITSRKSTPMVEMRTGRPEEAELAQDLKNRFYVAASRARRNFAQMLTVSTYGNK